MARADGTIFQLFEDEVCRRLLRHLLSADEPQTQKQLTAAVGLNASTISRRIAELDRGGLVQREGLGARAPYSLLFPGKTRELLQAAKDLAKLAAQQIAKEAVDDADGFRKEGLSSGNLRDQAKEGA